ncbi:hypothetical protein ACWOBX_08185 [Facklamia languida]
MLTPIFKDKELREYLSSMADDGCEINLQVQSEIARHFQGLITHEEMMNHLESEWRWQIDSERNSRLYKTL